MVPSHLYLLAGNWWLSYWSDNIGVDQTHTSKWYLGVYAVITLGSLIVTLIMKIYVARAGQRAARLLHEVSVHVTLTFMPVFWFVPVTFLMVKARVLSLWLTSWCNITMHIVYEFSKPLPFLCVCRFVTLLRFLAQSLMLCACVFPAHAVDCCVCVPILFRHDAAWTHSE